MRGAFLAALGAVLAGLPNAASAQSERQGFYAGLQLGVANATPVNSSLSGINHPTRCDVLLYPRSVRPPVHDPACLNTVPAVIASNEFDHGRGLASGVMVGYAAGVECGWRWTPPPGTWVITRRRSATRLSAALQGKGSECEQRSTATHEWIGDYAAHQFFADAYYDVRYASNWTPYVGAGIGMAATELSYYAVSGFASRKPSICWSHSIRTGRPPPNARPPAQPAFSIRRPPRPSSDTRCWPVSTTR